MERIEYLKKKISEVEILLKEAPVDGGSEIGLFVYFLKCVLQERKAELKELESGICN